VAILFIIFDLEVAFLFVLTIGFIYEWRKGALDWE
ncbi:MAG: NADH-quinone oxidoreductase subunit A, partial [Alphaproteobacteria bacterium]